MIGSAQREPLRKPPPLPANAALFLDFDGTLTEFASRPDLVVVPQGLLGLLLALRRHLEGAVAIVTGRRLADLDGLLAPEKFLGSGLHGAELRLMSYGVCRTRRAGSLASLANALRDRFADDPRIVVEDKGIAVALHYRQAPSREAQCLAVMEGLARWGNQLEVMRGDMVVEARPRGADKGGALRSLMTHVPFRGRLPVYAGDDVTDEAGFLSAQRLGGFGVKVRAGDSAARYCCRTVAHLHEWLRDSLPRAR